MSTVTTTTQRPARTVTLAFTGDLLLHNRVNQEAASYGADNPDHQYDYRPLLEPIRPWIEEADWAVCHLEVNLSADNTRLEPFPTFRSPGQIAHDTQDVGFDSCSVASNHILDHGVDGVAETLEVMDAAGLGSTGAARTADEAAEQIWVEVDSVRIAHLSYAYGFNGFTVPADAPWLTNIIDEAQILADAAQARAEGADIVLLSLHWGEQYMTQPNWQQSDTGPRLLASPDIDLIIGHHAHVVQPIENIDGEWLVYGLGNLLANAPRRSRRDELLVQVTLTEQPDGAFSSTLLAVPLFVDRQTLIAHPSNPATRQPTTDPELAGELDASWDRVQTILQTGSGWDHLELG
ncbi:MAG: CapA family protein [Actinomycetia bacterium]|nr:CapA family protein [Actinomycetes bacterium]MCP5034982.1 CapA family protein [Actinomycetes bacterium]